MWYHELDHDGQQLYNRTVLGPHDRRVEAYILTNDLKLVRDVTDLLMPGGEITGDTTREVLQVLSIDLADPGRTVSFDHPTSIPISRRRCLQIIDSRRIPDLGWVDVVVHTGPVWTADRVGDTIHVVAHDGGRLAMGTVRRRRKWTRKTRITTVITDLLRAAGAAGDQVRIPRLRPTLAKVVHVGHRPKRGHHHGKQGEKKRRPRDHRYTADITDTYFGEAQHLARALDRRLYVTPTLVFRLKKRSNRPALTIDRGDLLAPPSTTRPDEQRPNMWTVQGRDPKGKNHHRPTATAALPAADEESRESLAWHHEPTEHRVIRVNDHAKSKAAVKRDAVGDRDRALRIPQNREIVIPTIAHLQAWDVVAVRELGTAVMNQWRYPLSGAEGMTIGSTARIRAPRRSRA